MLWSNKEQPVVRDEGEKMEPRKKVIPSLWRIRHPYIFCFFGVGCKDISIFEDVLVLKGVPSEGVRLSSVLNPHSPSPES